MPMKGSVLKMDETKLAHLLAGGVKIVVKGKAGLPSGSFVNVRFKAVMTGLVPKRLNQVGYILELGSCWRWAAYLMNLCQLKMLGMHA